jgi:hypothetical protein
MKDKEDSFITLVKFWRWFHIFGIFINVILLSLEYIFKYNFVRKMWEHSSQSPIFSYPIMTIIQLIGLILSILIVYGLNKKQKIGLYASLTEIFYVNIILLMQLINSSTLYQFIVQFIGILIYSLIGYLFYMNQKYFYNSS